jgi:hypothetical protein
VITYTERQWWFNIRKERLVCGRWFAIWCCMDWWSGCLWLSAGWFGLNLQYLMPDINHWRLVSSAGMFWDAERPLCEGKLIFRKIREIRWYSLHLLNEFIQWKSERG